MTVFNIGVVIFGMACASALMGITEKVLFENDGKEKQDQYSSLPPWAYVANFLGVAIAGFALIVIYLVTKLGYRRRPLPEEQHISLEPTSPSSVN